jgi:hypothetical protein
MSAWRVRLAVEWDGEAPVPAHAGLIGERLRYTAPNLVEDDNGVTLDIDVQETDHDEAVGYACWRVDRTLRDLGLTGSRVSVVHAVAA